jgi:hypothetical protein
LEDKTRGLKIRDQPGLQNETLSKTNKQTNKKNPPTDKNPEYLSLF